MFKDRIDAADRLARALESLRGRHPLILAIPRGAVPMAARIARHLDGDLDIVLVRKLGAPLSPELAVGAIDEAGRRTVAPHALACGASPEYLDTQAARQQEEIRRRRARYTPGRIPTPVSDRIVVVVDDGIATGVTMTAALDAVRADKPARLICAVPVAAAESLAQVRTHADETVCLETPQYFDAVGRFYGTFPQVEDDEVVACLGPTDRLLWREAADDAR